MISNSFKLFLFLFISIFAFNCNSKSDPSAADNEVLSNGDQLLNKPLSNEDRDDENEREDDDEYDENEDDEDDDSNDENILPITIVFNNNIFTFNPETPIDVIKPVITGTVTGCSSNPELPSGLIINPLNCEISGTPIVAQGSTDYMITASNSYTSTNALINITVIPLPVSGETSPITGQATNISNTSVSLNGSFNNPSGYTTTVWFEYGLTTSYGYTSSSDIYIQSGPINFSKGITPPSLTESIHFRLVTMNSGGIFYGGDQRFVVAPIPVTVRSNLNRPAGLQYDGTYIYWMEIYSNLVARLNVNDNSVTILGSNMLFGGNDGSIAIDSSYIYLTYGYYQYLGRMNLDGSNYNKYYSIPLKSPYQMIAHWSGLYLRESECDLSTFIYRQTITRVSLDGQTKTQIFERPGNLPGNGGCGASGFGGSIIADNNYVYWTDLYNNNIQRLPIIGNQLETINTSIYRPLELLLKGTNLFVTHYGGASLIDLNSGMVKLIVSTGILYPVMALDNNYLYIITSTSIYKYDIMLDKASVYPIADEGGIRSIVVTPDNLYWLTMGKLKMMVKP